MSHYEKCALRKPRDNLSSVLIKNECQTAGRNGYELPPNLGPANTLEGKRQEWAVGLFMGLSTLPLHRPPLHQGLICTNYCLLLRIRGGEQLMGMESGPPTQLDMRNKMRGECLIKKFSDPSLLIIKSESSGIL